MKDEITFTNEIILHNDIELSVSGTCKHVDGHTSESMLTIDKIIETGRPNDSITHFHLIADNNFRRIVIKKIDRLFPRYS